MSILPPKSDIRGDVGMSAKGHQQTFSAYSRRSSRLQIRSAIHDATMIHKIAPTPAKGAAMNATM